jgi:anti-anti-sigma factor
MTREQVAPLDISTRLSFEPRGFEPRGFEPRGFEPRGPVVTISGEIDIQSGPQLRDHLLGVIRQHGARLALDLADVTFIDCAGINVLLAARRRAQLEGGSLRVLRASPRVRRVITLTHLGPVLMPAALPDTAVS